jgi:hypothetical protein
MTTDIESVIACQERLIAALDARDVNVLETVTVELDRALQELQARGAVHEREGGQLDYALRQSTAARIRVNVLADWTRQKIDRISEIRQTGSSTYAKGRKNLANR